MMDWCGPTYVRSHRAVPPWAAAKESGVAEAERSLVLWDIDRTLLYVGEIDRQVYRETFAEIVGRPAERLPARGTGVTMPLAIRSLLPGQRRAGIGRPSTADAHGRTPATVSRRARGRPA